MAENWAEIEKRFRPTARPAGGRHPLAVDRAVADRVVGFLAEHPIPQGELQVRQHIERMWVTVALRSGSPAARQPQGAVSPILA